MLATNRLPLATILLSLSTLSNVGAHADPNHPNAAAAVAGYQTPKDHATYIQSHMAQEHRIQAFDPGSFFALHDLNRDGVWDRPEMESIYGVHHSMSIKHSPSAEIHDEKADTIVKQVFNRLDTNGDAMISKSEFLQGGIEALPSFAQYGNGVLGHHYDPESEFIVHHEQVYHNTPETLKDSAFNHPEDYDHFSHHRKIEDEEENRERRAEGMPSIEEERKLRAQAQAKGQQYVSPSEQQNAPKKQVFHQGKDAYFGGYAQDEAASSQHRFRGPGGQHVVKSPSEKTGHKERIERLAGETDQGFEQRKQLYDQRLHAADYFDHLKKDQKGQKNRASKGSDLKQMPGESAEAFARRVSRVKAQGSETPIWRTQADREPVRNAAPKRFPPLGADQKRLKKGSYFGEF